MNRMADSELEELSSSFRNGLANNLALFGRHAFRKYALDQERRSVVNASLWDAMSAGLCRYSETAVSAHADNIKLGIWGLLEDDDFNTSITYATNGTERVRHRLLKTKSVLEGILGVQEN